MLRLFRTACAAYFNLLFHNLGHLQAFEAYDQSGSKTAAVSCIKYMLLCKVLNGAASEVPSILTSKIGMKHTGIELQAMAAIAKASKVRSLEDFQAAVSTIIACV
jgi:26S proteasome regulatory subunit N6